MYKIDDTYHDILINLQYKEIWIPFWWIFKQTLFLPPHLTETSSRDYNTF